MDWRRARRTHPRLSRVISDTAIKQTHHAINDGSKKI
jgi:hypothetical protein